MATKQKVLAERKKAHLLEKATDVFLELGYDATTLELIAERAEITRRTIYYYFSSKDAIFAAVVKAIAQSFANVIDVKVDPAWSAEENLTHYCETAAEELVRTRRVDELRLTIDVVKRLPHFRKDLGINQKNPFVVNLIKFIRELVKLEKIELQDEEFAAMSIIAVVTMPMQSVLQGTATPNEIPPVMRHFIRESMRSFCRLHGPRGHGAPKPEPKNRRTKR
jgi:AcrR family transcriptional regulator